MRVTNPNSLPPPQPRRTTNPTKSTNVTNFTKPTNLTNRTNPPTASCTLKS